MKAKLIIQVSLRSGDSQRVCWIDNPRVRVGSRVTLKNSEDPKRRWEVTGVWSTSDPALVHADWHVGGL